MTPRTNPAVAARWRSLPFAIAVVAMLFGILSGLRWPNLWSMTHLLFDYSSGFTKRGLAGEFLSHVIGPTISYGTLATLSFAIFALWVGLLFLRLRGLARSDHWNWWVAAVVLISPGFVFLVHEIGYFDHVGLVVVFLCFLMPASSAGLLGRILLCSVMVLTHEPFFLTFFPAVALDYWIKATVDGNDRRFATMLLLVAIVAAVTYQIGQWTLPAQQELAYTNHLADRAGDFPIRPDSVAVLFRDASDNLALMSELWQEAKRWRWVEIGALYYLPLPIALVLICVSMIRRSPLPAGTKPLLYLGAVGGAFSPLLLNVVAWDIWRFFALTQISAFLVFLTVSGHMGTTVLARPWLRPVGYVLGAIAILGVVTGIPLFDGYAVTRPPFLPHLAHLNDVLQGNAPWMQIPGK